MKGVAEKRGLVGLALSAPAMTALAMLFAIPLAAVIGISFTDWTFGLPDVHFVGFANFRNLATDDSFRRALINTVIYMSMVAPGTVGLGLVAALAIEASSALRGFLRAIHFLPYLSTLSAMAISWEALLHPTAGLVNRILSGMGLEPHNWLRDASTVLPSLAVIGIWQNFGYAMILFVSGLKGIPEDLYEAAALDGADRGLTRFRVVTLPALKPVLLFVSVIMAIRAFELFSAVRVLTQGEPDGASDVILYRLFTEGFSYLHLGYGSAITVVFLACMSGLTFVQFRVSAARRAS